MFEPVRLAADVALVRAPNPGPMTLGGTNTWVLGNPLAGPPLVVDPGPADDGHLAAVLAAAGGRVSAIVLTHWHLDHTESAAAFAEQVAAPVLAAADLADGTVLAAGGLSTVSYATPGHTADSLSLLVRGADGQTWLATGDMVLGRGTTVIMHPDGNLAAYFASLDVMARLVAEHSVAAILPGHGPVVTEPGEWLAYYRTHRRERLDQVRAALAAGARTVDDVVARVYADVPDDVKAAAGRSVAAQLEYLDALPDGS